MATESIMERLKDVMATINNIFPGRPAICSAPSEQDPCTVSSKESRPSLSLGSKRKAPQSSKEAKKLKKEYFEAKALITTLESSDEHERAIIKDLSQLEENQNSSIREQRERDEQELSDMNRSLEMSKNSYKEMLDITREASKNNRNTKMLWDQNKRALELELAELKDRLLEAEVRKQTQLSQLRKDLAAMQQAYNVATDNEALLRKEIAKLETRVARCTEMMSHLEQEGIQLKQAQMKLKQVQVNEKTYEVWETYVKITQRQLFKMAALEKEASRMCITENTLRGALFNKMLMQEQVNDLTGRIVALEPAQLQIQQDKMTAERLEGELEEWENAAQELGFNNARELRAGMRAARDAQRTDSARADRAAEKVTALITERDYANEKLNDVLEMIKNREQRVNQLQKQYDFITMEHECYRKIVEFYEKYPLGSGGLKARRAAKMAFRVVEMEKCLHGYETALVKPEPEP